MFGSGFGFGWPLLFLFRSVIGGNGWSRDWASSALVLIDLRVGVR